MQETLHAEAKRLRESHFGKNIFGRAVVELSNYCRQNCHYCGMRRDNRSLGRYRLSVREAADWIMSNLL